MASSAGRSGKCGAPPVVGDGVPYLGFRLAYALYDVPQNAVLAPAPVDDGARARLSSLRFVCSGLASLSLAPLAPLLLAQDRQAEHFAAFGAGVSLVAIDTSLAFMWTARRAPLLSRPALGRESLVPGERSSAGHAGAPRAILPLLGLGFVVATSSAVFMKLEPYFIAHYLAATLSRTAVMLGIAAGGIASQPFTVRIATRRGLAPAFRCAALVLAAGAAAFMALGSRSAAGAAAAGFVVGFGLNGLGMLIWTRVGNLSAGAAARQPLLSAPLASGLLTFTQKTASALGTVIVGAALELRGADVAPAITLAMGLVPLSGAAACLAFARRLDLPGRHAARRRAGCAEDAARTP